MKQQNSIIVHTTSSPFKVTMLDSTQAETTVALNTLNHKNSGNTISLDNIFTNSIKQMLLLCHNT